MHRCRLECQNGKTGALRPFWASGGRLAVPRALSRLMVGCIIFVFVDFCHTLCHVFACSLVAGFLLAGYDGAMQQRFPFPTVFRSLVVLALGTMALMAGGRVYAETAKPLGKPLDIAYGANSVDINADGVPDLIVRTRWDILSAHGADRLSIAVHLEPSDEHGDAGFYDVGTDKEPSKVFATSEGADCVTQAYRFWLNGRGMLVMRAYAREIGQSYSDPRPVTVTTYELKDRRQTSLGGTGMTPFYLAKIKERITQKQYCDVRDVTEK